MAAKITIIGAGSVGSTIAYTLSLQDIASELVLIDINKQKAEGEVMDILQGTAFRDPISIKCGDYDDAKDSDIVIITSGIARKPGMSRLDLTQTNVNILKSITKEIVAAAPNAYYILVSNPVDIMTYVFTKISGIPENKIIGSGTLLDTSRLRSGLSRHYNISSKNIHAYVYGEHGDSSFVPWSTARIATIDLPTYDAMLKTIHPEIPELDRDAMEEYVHKSGSEVIAKKGATFYAVSVSVCKLASILLSASDSIYTVSSMFHGEYGIEDVCLSALTLVGPDGIKGKMPLPLNEEETKRMQDSANTLKAIIAQLDLTL